MGWQFSCGDGRPWLSGRAQPGGALWWLLAMALFAFGAVGSEAQESFKCFSEYQNHNMVDYGPLVFRHLSGRAIDPASVEIPGVCVGIFTEREHRLIATAVSDQDGKFALPAIPAGRYRLVAIFPGFCAANVPVKIVRWPRGDSKSRLVLHTVLPAIDACSYGDYK